MVFCQESLEGQIAALGAREGAGTGAGESISQRLDSFAHVHGLKMGVGMPVALYDGVRYDSEVTAAAEAAQQLWRCQAARYRRGGGPTHVRLACLSPGLSLNADDADDDDDDDDDDVDFCFF